MRNKTTNKILTWRFVSVKKGKFHTFLVTELLFKLLIHIQQTKNNLRGSKKKKFGYSMLVVDLNWIISAQQNRN